MPCVLFRFLENGQNTALSGYANQVHVFAWRSHNPNLTIHWLISEYVCVSKCSHSVSHALSAFWISILYTHTHTTIKASSHRTLHSVLCLTALCTVSLPLVDSCGPEQSSTACSPDESRQIELKVLHVQSWKWLYGKQRAKDRHLPTRLARIRHLIRLHLEKWWILAHLTDDGVWLREWVTGDYRETGAGLLGIERARTALSRRARCR